jgi:hypothetical protein
MISPPFPWDLRSAGVQIVSTDAMPPNLQNRYRQGDIYPGLLGLHQPTKALDI